MAAGEPTATPTLIQSISLGLGGYNKAFQLVGTYLLASPEAFIREPLQEIARAAGVSEPTVLRFCRQFGFKGLPAPGYFQRYLREGQRLGGTDLRV